jgi:hypothetical protein
MCRQLPELNPASLCVLPHTQVRFLVMGNIFCTAGLAVQQRYDLKGSTKGRTAGPAALKVRRGLGHPCWQPGLHLASTTHVCGAGFCNRRRWIGLVNTHPGKRPRHPQGPGPAAVLQVGGGLEPAPGRPADCRHGCGCARVGLAGLCACLVTVSACPVLCFDLCLVLSHAVP